MKLPLLILFLTIAIIGTTKEKLAVTHGPFIQYPGETGITITWTTNKTAVAWVEAAPDDTVHQDLKDRQRYYSEEFGFKQLSKVHIIRLSNLLPGVTYTYCIYSQAVAEQSDFNIHFETVALTHIEGNKPLKFTTLDTIKEKKLSFLILNDIHEHNDLFNDLLVKADYPSADLILFNGDMVNNIKNDEQYFKGFLDQAVSMFASNKPLYYIRGNHETRGSSAVTFPQYFKSPEGKLYYLFRRGPVCFVILDSGENLPDTDILFRGMRAFDQYRDSECDWLREALKSKEYMDAPFKIVILHVPPFSGWHGADEIASKFVPLLNEAKADLMICGHLHKYVYREPGNGINFPVIVNSNNTVLKAEADSAQLNLRIIDRKGELVDFMQFNK